MASSDVEVQRRVVALAGGVGAARFLRGLLRCVAPERIQAVVNTGDDREFYGVHVSPDLDIVTYTLAGLVDPVRGFGLEGDGHRVIEALGRFGHETWFRLGDRDLATCLHRSHALREGRGLAEVTDEIRRAFRVPIRLLPMSEDACPTFVERSTGERVHFEEYLVRDGAPDDVSAVDLSAARAARPGPGVREALADATLVLVCPSNPVVSVGPILAVPGVREAIARSGAPVVGVSPLVGGAPVKGPAAPLLRGVGAEVSAPGIVAHYDGLLSGLLMDERDAAEAPAVEALGVATRCTDTLMRDPEAAERVARAALELGGGLR